MENNLEARMYAHTHIVLARVQCEENRPAHLVSHTRDKQLKVRRMQGIRSRRRGTRRKLRKEVKPWRGPPWLPDTAPRTRAGLRLAFRLRPPPTHAAQEGAGAAAAMRPGRRSSQTRLACGACASGGSSPRPAGTRACGRTTAPALRCAFLPDPAAAG